HLYLGAPQQLEENLLISQIGDFLGKNDLSVDSYDFKRVYRYFRERGEVISPSFDLFTADYLLSPSSAGGSLAEIAGRYLDWLPPEYTGKESEEEVEKISMMASSRVAAIMEMKDSMEERLKVEELLDLYLEIERPMAKILAEMELEGIGIDIEGFEETARAFRKELRKIEEKIFSIAGTNFNINSPAQLSEILFEKRGLKPLRKTKKGFSTAEDVLQKLSKFDPLPEHVLDYRHYQKLNSTYVEPLPKMADNDRGRLHTSFNIAGTATGRLSSSEPNLQNIPVRSKEGGLIRKSFIPSPNSVFLSADYSQIDLRVLAHLSGDEGLRESFIKGEDIHRATAARVFDLDEKEVTDEMRKRAKAVNFGIVYGISGWGLSKNIDMTPKESEAFIKKYFERYPGIKDYMDKTLDGVKEKGYVKTILGRTRHFPEIKSKNYVRRGLAERAAINTPVQGSSADIIKKATVELAA
ncbi:MAG: DNA polymerase I, partial [Elusimicrobia bacterium]|nr:DNA polymerase I [Elusimicrobiota bacterium]